MQLSNPQVANGNDGARESVQRPSVSARIPDWSREHCGRWAWDPGRQLLRAVRDYQRAIQKRGPFAVISAKLAVLRYRLWSVITGADVPLNTRIGGGLMIPHPNGIVVHPDVEIGPNCMIFQQVTIGTGPKDGLPRLGGHVDVGPGAKLLGGIHIGDHATIGANAVVLCDVPSGATAVGVPAKISRIVTYSE